MEGEPFARADHPVLAPRAQRSDHSDGPENISKDAFHLPEELRKENVTDTPPASLGTMNLSEAVNDYERKLVERALREAGGIQTRAADLLGTTRRILKYRMQKLSIDGATVFGGDGEDMIDSSAE